VRYGWRRKTVNRKADSGTHTAVKGRKRKGSGLAGLRQLGRPGLVLALGKKLRDL
jgi:hypothetical protein